MENTSHSPKKITGWGIALLSVGALIAGVYAWIKRRRSRETLPTHKIIPPPLPQDIQGLSLEEAESRQLEGQDNSIQLAPPRLPKDMWKENTFTVFNFSLVGMVVAQLLLGHPLDALISFGVLILNIVMNIGREVQAQRKLAEFERAARPKVTVVRGGEPHSLEPNEIVVDDMIIAGPGDRIFVDGEVSGKGDALIDEALVTGKSERITKSNGDELYAGSFCVSGRIVYKAKKIGNERAIVKRINNAPIKNVQSTPLERIVDKVLKALLLVVFFLILLLARAYLNLDSTASVDEQAFIDAASIIFSIAPSSLYFMIILTYIAGTADLAKRGAVVRQARSVESLAQSSVICFAQAGILMGAHIDVEAIEAPKDNEEIPYSRLQQILGDYAYNTATNNIATRTLANTFDGTQRKILAEAPFLSAYGWSAIIFDDADLHGTYILGQSDLMESHLIEQKDSEVSEKQDDTEEGSAVWRKAVSPFSKLFNRSKEKEEPKEKVETLAEAEGEQSKEEEAKPNFFRKISSRIGDLLQGAEDVPDAENEDELATEKETFTFAYLPETSALNLEDGKFQLPNNLIPLCKLSYSQKIHPESIDTIKAFVETGVRIKVFTPRSPKKTLAIMKKAGLGKGEKPLKVVTGAELAKMNEAELAHSAKESVVFGNLAPEQTGWVVEALRKEGETVAVIGDKVTDLPAMREANLSIARQSSSQAALSFADIILVEESPKTLQVVLEKGQFIANGLLDILKLNLTQVLYLALLIVGIRLGAAGFPYLAEQGTLINGLTLAIPSAALTFWAPSGVLPKDNLGKILARFVAPAAITMSAVATLVYRIFLERTGEIAYAQITLTYTLIIAGLLLVIFVKLPEHLGVVFTISKRYIGLVIGLFLVFLLVLAIPFTRDFFALTWLQSLADYLIVAVAVLAWMVTLRLILVTKFFSWQKN